MPGVNELEVDHRFNGHKGSIPSRLYSTRNPPSLKALRLLCENVQIGAAYVLAKEVANKIPIYDLTQFSPSASEVVGALQDEWHHILQSGPGVFVLKNFFPDIATLDTINSIFDAIIAAEALTARGDHFAAAGKNSRIWNSFQKHAEKDSSSFIRYYSNPWLAHVSEAWLGPAYQVTAQVNIVRPGGSPQVCHRDFHLGFQTAESCQRYPRVTQVASQYLTLQGAIAHSQVPLESGPTRFLPFSQKFEEGYMAYRLPEFQEYFNKKWVSCPMQPGDAVFFNPALFHAAGENLTSGIHRSANLLQISSAFGKPMESINTSRLIELCWPQLSDQFRSEGLSQEVKALISAIALGYAFPTDLDKRPPAPGGMAPESEADIVVRGLQSKWTQDQIMTALQEYKMNSSA